MDPDFWLQRWDDGEIGFHREEVNPALTAFWPQLGLHAATPVLVPLCGKSLDMLWLRDRGHPVAGIELSPKALDQFVQENALALRRSGTGYAGDGWQLIAGDFFEVGIDPPLPAFYDRAALSAMPPDRRNAYVRQLRTFLTPVAVGLLITLEYDQREMDGPPFAAPAQQVEALFSRAGHAEEWQRVDVLADEPRFIAKGLSRLEQVVWKVGFDDG